MNVGFVSTFPPMLCAIGIYTEKLATALKSNGSAKKILVFTESHVEPQTPSSGIDVHPCYQRDADYVNDLERAIVTSGCSLVHFQHAGDLLGEDARLPTLLARLENRGIRTIVTLHTIYEERQQGPFRRGKKHADFYRATAAAASHLVVHQDEGCATRLAEQGIDPRKISIIAHGTTPLLPPSRAEARRILELPQDAFLFTFFGFIHLQKNVHRVVEAFASVAKKHPHARLLISGMPWGDRWYNHLYTNLIKARVLSLGLGSRILVRDRYLPREHVNPIYGASDVILLPHHQTYGSASGVFHQAIGAGKPVLCAIGPKFVEAQLALASTPELCVSPRSTRDWSSAMNSVIEDAELLERGRNAVRDYAAATEWPAIAQKHAELYSTLLR